MPTVFASPSLSASSGTARSRAACLVLAACSLCVLSPAPARAQSEKKVCADAYVKGQRERQAERLLDARRELLVCARDRCPEVLRKDCVRWAEEVQQQLPTVVVAARTSRGRDLVDVRVLVDGEPFLEQVTGNAKALDPGVYTFRFEAEGFDAVEQRVVVRQGERDRPVTATFADEGPPRKAARAAAERPVPPLTYAFGGLGVASLGVFTYFALRFDGQVGDLEVCKPDCAQSDVDDAEATRRLSFVPLGVGVVSLGVAAALFLTRPEVEPPPPEAVLPRVDVHPVAGGAVTTLGARF